MTTKSPAHLLSHTVSILKLTQTVDSTGMLTPIWHTKFTNIHAKIEPIISTFPSQTEGVKGGREVSNHRLRAFVDASFDITEQDRLIYIGRTYDIQATFDLSEQHHLKLLIIQELIQ